MEFNFLTIRQIRTKAGVETRIEHAEIELSSSTGRIKPRSSERRYIDLAKLRRDESSYVRTGRMLTFASKKFPVTTKNPFAPF